MKKIYYIADTRMPTEMAHGLQIMKMCEAFASLDSRGFKADNRGYDKLLYEDITYKIRGCVFNVYNALGFGHKELIYQKALEKEFSNRGLEFDTQKSLGVYYNKERVGVYKPDFIIEDKIIIEIKSLEFLSKKHQNQTLYYLRGTEHKLALLINFGAPKLQIKRLIFQHNNQRESEEKNQRKSESMGNQRESEEKNQRKSEPIEVELVVPRRFAISSIAKDNPFDYYKVEKNFKIKKIFCFDLTPLNRFLGPISFGIQALSFSFFAFLYLLPKRNSLIYGRDRFGLLFVSFFKRYFFEVHKTHKRFFEIFLRRAKKIITISNGIKKKLIEKGIPEVKILNAPDGIDIEDFDIKANKQECRKILNLPADKKLVIYTGHLYRWKGVEILALASKYLPENYLVVIVGGIKWYFSNFKKFVEKNELKNILLLGHRHYSEIPYFLKAADCLVLTGTEESEVSKNQTSPMKMFEYMASKTPIIVSNLPSFREILNDNNAMLTESDNPQAMAQKIMNLMENNDMAKKISEQAYNDVQNYTWQKRAEKILNFINLN